MWQDFSTFSPYLLGAAFLLAAALYASVGHGGASAYLALMGLCGMAPKEMKPVALVLNIVVATVSLIHFVRAGHFQFRLFWPLILASVPAAFLGGSHQSSDSVFKLILAAALVLGSWRLLVASPEVGQADRVARLSALLLIGAVIGFLSGLIGIGGGIFLTPLLILLRWSSAKTAAALSAAFIVANSCSGLGGFMLQGGQVPAVAWMLLPCVVVGGWAGSRWGSGAAPSMAMRRVLATVLLVAAAKFLII